jgi:hypothetical protein
MSYNYEKFLKPLREGDKILRIFDDLNVVKYNINPFSVQRVFVSGSNVNISLVGNRTITLDFTSGQEARDSLLILLMKNLKTLLIRNS